MENMKYRPLLQFTVQSCGSCGFAIPQEAIACPRCGNQTIVPANVDAAYQAYKVTKMEEQQVRKEVELVAKQEQNLEQYFEKRLEYESKWKEKWNMSLVQILFSFQGRINRGKWWILTYMVSGLLGLAGEIIASADSLAGLIFGLLFLIPFIYTHLALTIKRLKDTNRGWGWGSLIISSWLGMAFSIFLLPTSGEDVFSGIFLFSYSLMFPVHIICGFFKGTHGPNQYGPDPLLKKKKG